MKKDSNPQNFSPKAFIRARRPEKFSDSISSARPILNRSQLEYHLDSLTSRNQEHDFERFALALAKKTIAPNLRPLTGPTGGGDSKVDSETFPVHEDLALAWHEKVDLDAANQRWAFAVSAKKQWRQKIQSDLEKIAQTERGYQKAFFISNQFIRDKSRAEVEDALHRKYAIDLRILDRSWILDQVFSGGHEELAIRELKIETAVAETRSLGPRDIDREQRLFLLEARIEEATTNRHFGPILVDDGLEAAKIARALDRPRIAVEGMLARAERLASRYGTFQQKVAAAYAQAWTAYWWHEDYSLFIDLYSSVEELALNSNNVYDLELLNNLWMILFSLERLEDFSREALKLDQRAIAISGALRRISEDETKPTAALQAHTILLIQSLFCLPREAREGIFTELDSVLKECGGMIGFPVESIIELIIELGQNSGDSPAYEQLAETATELAGTRKGEIEAASVLLERGYQKLSDERIYDAINLIGRALGLLSKHESQDNLVAALGALGYAYEKIGLLWAARGSFLMATTILVNRFHTYTDLSLFESPCFRRLRWIELQLGRLPHLLAAYELEQLLRKAAATKKLTLNDRTEDDSTFDAIVSILLLRSGLPQLKEMTNLPATLDALELFYANITLLYALGHIDEAVEYLPFQSSDEIESFFTKVSQQPAADDLPETPLLMEGPTVELASRLLGTSITIEAENSPACLDLTESLLATLEAMLATAFRESVIAVQTRLDLRVRSDASTLLPFHYQATEKAGEVSFDLISPAFDSLSLSRDDQEKIYEHIWKLAAEIFARVFVTPNFERTAQTLFKDQLAADRAISYAGGLAAFRNIFGRDAKTSIRQWFLKDAPAKVLRRTSAWKPATDKKSRLREKASGSSNDLNHRKLVNVSLIRLSLWDQANWRGAMYAVDPSRSSPSVMALAFRNRKPAIQIFEAWKAELGEVDTADQLRITIIRGINRREPFSYRILIGTNLEKYPPAQEAQFFTTANRSVVVNPSDSKNLDGFLASFRHFGGYFLSFVQMEDDGPPDEPAWDIFLVKRTIHVREAWSIGVGDVDSIGIGQNDDPVIPTDVQCPPVLELIAQRKTRPA